MKSKILAVGLMLGALSFSACAPIPDAATPMDAPAAVVQTNSPLPKPIPSPSTSASPEQTASPTPSPSAEATAEPTPSPTPSATPTPEPIPTTVPAEPSIVFTKIEKTLYTTQALNVRTGPGTSHAIIDTLPSGDEVPVDAEYGNWVRIEGSDLWIHSGYLTETKPFPKPDTSHVEEQVRAILKSYGCPSTSVVLDDARLGETANGKTDWYSNTVLIRSTTPVERLTYVVAHECMHLRQYDVYGGDIEALEASMNKAYGGSGFEGLEQNADCMTQRLGIAVFSYTTKCSGARGKAAETVLGGATL